MVNPADLRRDAGPAERVIDLRDAVVGARLPQEPVPDLPDLADLPALADVVEPRSRAGSPGARLGLVALLGDVVALVLAGLAATALPGAGLPGAAVGALVLLWLAVLALEGAYDGGLLWAARVPVSRVAHAAAVTLLLADAAVLVVGAPLPLGGGALLPPVVLVLTGLPLLLVVRLALALGLRRARRRGVAVLEMVAVGPAATVRRLLDRRPQGWRVVAACVPDVATEVSSRSGDVRVRVAGRPTDAARVARRLQADVVWVAPGALDRDGLRRLGWQLGRDVRLLVSPGLTDVHAHRLDMHLVDHTPVLELRQPKFTGGQLVVKRCIDVLVSAAGLLVLLPALLALMALVRLDSPGPALFRQPRVGLNGRQFSCLKLRTMYTDAEARLTEIAERNAHGPDGVLFKVRDDPRVTRVGRRLRKLSLDELPQLVNVLRGEMSLVGPRPPLPREVDRYEDDVRRRLLVKPGITGLWQVSGRSDLSWEESVRLDLSYVDNWSPWLDTWIVAKTAQVVLSGRGAY